MKKNKKNDGKDKAMNTGLTDKLRIFGGYFGMTIFGVITSWASGFVPKLHRPVAA